METATDNNESMTERELEELQKIEETIQQDGSVVVPAIRIYTTPACQRLKQILQENAKSITKLELDIYEHGRIAFFSDSRLNQSQKCFDVVVQFVAATRNLSSLIIFEREFWRGEKEFLEPLLDSAITNGQIDFIWFKDSMYKRFTLDGSTPPKRLCRKLKLEEIWLHDVVIFLQNPTILPEQLEIIHKDYIERHGRRCYVDFQPLLACLKKLPKEARLKRLSIDKVPSRSRNSISEYLQTLSSSISKIKCLETIKINIPWGEHTLEDEELLLDGMAKNVHLQEIDLHWNPDDRPNPPLPSDNFQSQIKVIELRNRIFAATRDESLDIAAMTTVLDTIVSHQDDNDFVYGALRQNPGVFFPLGNNSKSETRKRTIWALNAIAKELEPHFATINDSNSTDAEKDAAIQTLRKHIKLSD